MVALPAETPVTTPVADTVAEPELLVQVPPGIPSVSAVVRPAHTLAVPEIVDGEVYTVTGVTVWQPVDVIVNVIFDVPAVTPVTTPELATTEATPTLPLAHVPGPDASPSVVVSPVQTLVVPVITAGNGFTVTTDTV